MLTLDIRRLLFILVRALHPDERLQINHVARAQVAQVTAHDRGELKQAGISVPLRAQLVLEIKAVGAGCALSQPAYQYLAPRSIL